MPSAASSGFPRHPLPVYLLLCVVVLSTSVAAMRCTDSRTWRCTVRGMRRINETIPAEPPEESGATPYDISYTYMIKVNPEEGRLYTSGRLRWQMKPSLLANATTLNVHIASLNGTTVTSIFLLEVMGKQDRRYRPESSVDFYIHVADILQLGHAYQVTVTADDANFTGTSLIKLPPPVADEVDCSAAVSGGESLRTQQAARFSILYRELMVYPTHSMINISFYGAPHAYCIPSYDVQLYLEDLLLVKSHTILKEGMTEENGFPVGVTAFNGVEHAKNYTIRIVPNSYLRNWTGCVCQYNGNCGCITTVSAMFSFPGLQSVDERPPKDGEQMVRIHVLDEETADKGDHDMFYLLISVALLALTLFFLALIVLLLCQRKIILRHKGNLLLIRGGVDQLEEIRKPLIRSGAVKPASVLLLVDDHQRPDVAEALAKLLQAGGVRVRYMPWERELVEQGITQWIQNVLTTTEKILLCHTQKAADIVTGKYSTGLFDDVYREMYCALKHSDPKLVHVRFDACRLLLPLNAEVVYSIPSNLHALFDSLKVPLSKTDSASFQKLYNHADNEVRCEKEGSSHMQNIDERQASSASKETATSLPETNEGHQPNEPMESEGESQQSSSGYYSNEFPTEMDGHPHDIPMIDHNFVERKKSVERESVRSDSGIIA